MKYIGFALAVIGYLIVSEMDYEDALLQERIYCENVRDGVWPNYNTEIECHEQK